MLKCMPVIAHDHIGLSRDIIFILPTANMAVKSTAFNPIGL